MMNTLVRWYIKRFNIELDQVRYDTPMVQQDELEKILRSPLTQLLNPKVDSNSNSMEFKANAPITTYDYYSESIEALMNSPNHRVEYYAQSSGTSGGAKKLVPTPESFVRANHLRGSWYILNTLYNTVPDMNVFKAKNLLIGGAIYERKDRFLIGDVSGIMLNRIPSFFRPFYIPTIAEAILPDWTAKLEITIHKASKSNDVSLLAGVPTWVLAALAGVKRNIGAKKISDHWPQLKAYIHGGVSLTPYMRQFQDLIDLPNFKFIEVYNATEGFFAIQDNPDEEGMLLLTKSGIYFEFIRYRDYASAGIEDILDFEDVVLGEHYVLLVSTQSGLLRYIMGDIIQFVSIAPFKIKVAGRISEYINAFGEDLMLWQVEEALYKICDQHNVSVNHFTVGPKYLSVDEKGWHDWAIEFEHQPGDMETFAEVLDNEIQYINSNYAQKRYQSLALECLRIHPVEKGTFSKYLKNKGMEGGQSKVKKLSNNRDVLDKILIK